MSKAIITEQHLHDIADAIIAKGGATAPMTPAQMPEAIASIQSGGEGLGNELPEGCPRIDLVELSQTNEEGYYILDGRDFDTVPFGGYFVVSSGTITVSEVEIANDGSVTVKSNSTKTKEWWSAQDGSGILNFQGGRYVVVRVRADSEGATFSHFRTSVEMYNYTNHTDDFIPVALKARCTKIGYGNKDFSRCQFLFLEYEESIDTFKMNTTPSSNRIIVEKSQKILFSPYENYALRIVLEGKVIGTGRIGYNCPCLVECDFSKCDFSEFNFHGNDTYNCRSLRTLKMGGPAKGFAHSCDLSGAAQLNHASLISVIGSLIDLTGGTAQTLTLGATLLAKLTDAEKQIATDKNWILA